MRELVSKIYYMAGACWRATRSLRPPKLASERGWRQRDRGGRGWLGQEDHLPLTHMTLSRVCRESVSGVCLLLAGWIFILV